MISNIILIILISFYMLYNFYNIGKIGYRFVFDGADQRSPYVITLLLLSNLLFGEILYFLCTSKMPMVFIFLSQTYSFFVSSFLTRSRLIGYTTMNLSKNTKSFIFIILTTMYISCTMIWIMMFQPELFVYTPQVLGSWEHYKLYITMLNINYVGWSNYLFLIICFINFVVILGFDIIEKRRKYYLIDLTFLIPFIVIACFIANGSNPPGIFLFFLGVIYLLSPLISIQKEILSIIRHSNLIDSRVDMIKKILKSIASVCPNCKEESFGSCAMLTKDVWFQIKLICQMLQNDDHLKEIILQKSIFTSRAYKRVINQIERFCNEDLNYLKVH